MTITAVAPVLPAALVPQTVATPAPREPFDPAPALRPTIQDKIEIDQALLALRTGE